MSKRRRIGYISHTERMNETDYLWLEKTLQCAVSETIIMKHLLKDEAEGTIFSKLRSADKSVLRLNSPIRILFKSNRKNFIWNIFHLFKVLKFHLKIF